MDHPHYPWSPLPGRGVLRWPDGARLAACVIVSLEHLEWPPPAGSYQPPTLAGGLGSRPYPDTMRVSHREYGHRVGIFRLLDVLARHGIRPTIAIDAFTAEHYGPLVHHCRQRGVEFIGHGLSLSRMITSRMSEPEERDYIRLCLEALARAVGSRPAGWLGPEYGESTRTPRLLAEAGLRYVCDWVNDEQPYRMTTPQGELFALPIRYELDDVHALWDRRVPMDRYARMIDETVETLHAEGAESGRLVALHLHPWLVGQPFRIGELDAALGRLRQRDGIWCASGSEIVDWYRTHPPAP
jgi:peptidoglycan/xylan/chitin deacetylase (PgdA/CDA1 family)